MVQQIAAREQRHVQRARGGHRRGDCKYAFTLTDVRAQCPWYDQALSVWQRRLGDSEAARYAIACRLNDAELSTIKNYAGKWRLFLSFYVDEQCSALPATPETVTKYIGFLARRGTIHADSMGQYLAAISKAHAHCGVTPPVRLDSDELIILSSTLKGLSKLQKQIYSEDAVRALRSPSAGFGSQQCIASAGGATICGRRAQTVATVELSSTNSLQSVSNRRHGRVQLLRLRSR